VLGAGNTLTIKNALVEHAPDGTTWSTLLDQTGVNGPIPPDWPAAGVVDTGGSGGSTQRGVVAFSCDIKRGQRYVRFDFTPQLSAANTDTFSIIAAGVLSGFSELPPGQI
jgi:hypothetical protein